MNRFLLRAQACFCIGVFRVRDPTGQIRLVARVIYCIPQSNEVTILEGPPVSSALSFVGGVHIGAGALHVLNLIARLSQWGAGG